MASMNEALDISMHLKPLASHFQVNFFLMTKTNAGGLGDGEDDHHHHVIGHGGCRVQRSQTFVCSNVAHSEYCPLEHAW